MNATWHPERVRSRRGSSGLRLLGIGSLAAVPVAFLAIFFALPLLGMLGRGLRAGGTWDLSGFGEVLGRAQTIRIVWFTVWISVCGTAITVALGLPVAYALYRLRLPGRHILRAVVTAPFVLPTVVVGVAFRTALRADGPFGWLGIDGSWVAILAALVFFNLAVVVRSVGMAWAALDFRRQESAATLGAPPLRVLRTVTLPALAPAIRSAAAVVFLFCFTAYGVVLVLGGLRYSTVETQIYLLTTQYLDLRGAAVLSLCQLVVVAAILLLARGFGDSAVNRSRSSTRGSRPTWRDLPALAVTAVVLILVLVPVVTLVVRSLRIQGAWSLQGYRDLATTGTQNALVVPVWTALDNSLRAAVDATAIAVPLGLLVAVLLTRRPRSGRTRRAWAALDGLVMLPLGVSAVTIGFGFLVTLNRPPLDLRTSSILVPIAQATVALPLVVRVLAPALGSVDDRLRQAAAALGAAPLRVLASVDLPLVWRPLLGATGFAFAVSLGEFGATSFLSRSDRPTLPVVVYRLIGRPGAQNLAMALAASVVLTLVTVALMALVERLRVGSLGRP